MGCGFGNISELKAMKFNEVMKGNNKNDWIKEVVNEKFQFDWCNTLTAVKKNNYQREPRQ